MMFESFSWKGKSMNGLKSFWAIRGKSISEEVNELLRRRLLKKLKGAEALKREHVKFY
jgi:hypothetical protein